MGIVDGIPFGFPPPSALPAAPRPLPPLGLPLSHSVITSGLPLQEGDPMQDSIDSSDAAAFRSAQFLQGNATANATRSSGLGAVSGNLVSRAALFNSQRGPSARNVVLQIAHNNNNSTAGVFASSLSVTVPEHDAGSHVGEPAPFSC
jgi:hypothetical protein